MIPDYRVLSFDTSALIYYLEKREPYRTWLRPFVVAMDRGDCKLVFAVVAYAELRVRPLREGNDDALTGIETLMSSPNVDLLPVSREIAREGSEVRAQHNLELADSLIVATAIASGCDALIGNDKTCARRVTEIPYIYLDEVTGRSPA